MRPSTHRSATIAAIVAAGSHFLSTLLGPPAAGAQNITATITSDNAHAVGTGGINGINGPFLGSLAFPSVTTVVNTTAAEIFTCSSAGPESYSIPYQPGNYIYVVAFSDDGTSQGLLAQFQRGPFPKVYSGVDPGSGHFWEVCATGDDFDSGGPSVAAVNAKIALCNQGAGPAGTSSQGWRRTTPVSAALGNLAFGEANTSGGEFPAVTPCMDSGAHWMWYNSDPVNCPNAFKTTPGCPPGGDHREYLIFRIQQEATSVEVGVNKDLRNHLDEAINDVEFLLEGAYPTVLYHYDGGNPYHFQNFAVTQETGPSQQPRTRLRWSNPTNPIPPGAIFHVGFTVPGSSVELKGVFYTFDGNVVGCGRQVASGTHLLGQPGGQVYFQNTCDACEAISLEVGDLAVEWYAQEVPLDQLNATAVRHPLRTDRIPVPAAPLAPGETRFVEVPEAPPEGNWAVVTHSVSSRFETSGTDTTIDFLQFPRVFRFPPTVQDCPGAIPVCQRQFTQNPSFQGSGNIPGEINAASATECLQVGERNDVWYTLNVASAGQLCFSITPNGSADYDWALYDLTSNSCSEIFSNPALETSCNYSGIRGVTGANGLPGAQNRPCVSVAAGQTYVLNVSNHIDGSLVGYTLDFSASTAGIVDTVPPALTAVVPPVACNSQNVTLKTSENVLCSTVQPGDFRVTPPAAAPPIPFTGITGASCAAGGSRERTFTGTLASPLSVTGSYSLCLGNAAGSVTDLCGNAAPSGCVPFVVDCRPPCSRQQTLNLTCEVGPGGQLTGNFVWTFQIANLSNRLVSHLYFDGLPTGVTVDRPHLVFNPAIQPGGTRTETVVIRGATTGQTLTFPMVLLDAALEACCSFSFAVTLPECRCAQILSDVVPSCLPFLPPPYPYTFNLQNLAPSQVTSLIVTPVVPPNTPIPPGVLDVAPVPIHLSTPIGMGGTTGNKTVVISGSGALPGSQVCLLLSLHDQLCENCCSIPRCFTLPSCFFSDVDFYPLGAATVLFSETGIEVTGIGSTGEDGIEAQTGGAAAIELGWLPLAPAASTGASISVGATAAGEGGDRLLGSLRVTGGAGGYEIAADLSGIGSGPLQIEIFDDADLVATATGEDGAVGQVSGWPAGGGAAIVTGDGDPAAYGLFLEGPGLAFTLPGANPVVGNRLRVSAASASVTPPLSSLRIQAANIPEITIVRGDVQPPAGAACVPGPAALCLGDGRFKVEVAIGELRPGPAQALPLTADTGYFWFFDAGNIEVVVKLLDGRSANGHWWVFSGSLSDVAYSLKVTDTTTGAVRTYDNPPGRLASFGDTAAFPEPAALAAAAPDAPARLGLRPRHAAIPVSDALAPCVPGPEDLCLNGNRFEVAISFRDDDTAGAAKAVALTGKAGYFWFFESQNVEVVVKVLDGRAVNGHWWVFFGALSDVEYTVTVTDTVTGAVRTYHNPEGVFASRADTAAF